MFFSKAEKKVLTVDGMMCAHCAASVERALKAVAGVKDAVVNLETKTATVSYKGDVSEEQLREAVTEAGFTVITVSAL